MEQALFERFRAIAYSRAGIALNDAKEDLVSTRVGRRLRVLGLPTEKAYLSFLENDASGEELVHFLDAISTNFTSFFRESEHFEVLGRVLADWRRKGQRRFRLWCAAASTGEEPYTLAMVMHQALGDTECDWRILATDISTKVLKEAATGLYGADAMEKVAPDWRTRYFQEQPGSKAGEIRYQVRDWLRKHLVFKRLNLIETPFPMPGPVDVIFCRNVMIYFDRPVKLQLVSEMTRLLKTAGVLMVGHAESLAGISPGLVSVQPAVYRKL